ncbi:enolase C-terminal domain-like protein [Mycobacterium sp. EPa45]|uniref:enolase C-terminal domain-like protein n=1 Tax=Mycobacterium sp. EPa45 TaxID=1545728 RepID=UPI0006428450|nr:enolase C-terminal domain-like protein [Mycobacterium sp. EPa45]AKK26957.1 mandelate racemase [Mycobacterium sp. EPa45]
MSSPLIDGLDVTVYRVPTAGPEADGTLQWEATTAVVVHAHAAGATGLGWTYSSPGAAAVITHHLRDVVVGREAADIPGATEAMNRACRNFGTTGLVAQAISAVDIALWDLIAHLRELPLAAMLGRCRTSVPIYGSGGFTNLDDDQLAAQVRVWQDAGCTTMKIKIGQSWGGDTDRDLARVTGLLELVGDTVELMVDANGGYTPGQARRVGAALDRLGVTWFEEPVSSDDIKGLAAVRGAVRCDVAAGEYIANRYDARRLAPVVDCLQLDVTRCGGYTGWLAAANIAAAHNLDVSGHCAPALHVPVAAAVPRLRHLEYFIDHTRLEAEMFDGVPTPSEGVLPVTSTHVGHGMKLAAGATKFRQESC